MKNLALTIAGACLAMLATSGIVAFATARTPETAVADAATDEQIEERIGELIDAQYQQVLARK